MSERCNFDYAVFRYVPRVDREEFFNVGVILSCPSFKFLDAKISVSTEKMRCFAPDTSFDEAVDHLSVISRICAGDLSAGPIAALGQRERFYWLTAQRSTTIQSSPVHTGLTADPEATLNDLLTRYVL